MARLNVLKNHLPWTRTPLIVSAPMSGAATSKLAVAVTRAGGLGQIGFMDDMAALSNELNTAKHELQDLMNTLPNPQQLPIGMGVIVFGSPIEAFMQLFAAYQPAVAWLSFGSTSELRAWTEGIRRSSPETKVWIQLGSLQAALDVALVCRPDVLVVQGGDAAAHGHQNGASVLSLIPEIADTLQENELHDIPLVAAGGIVDGRGCAAALALGASGVVMGTRFLAATETQIPQSYRDAIFKASDGGEVTARSRVFDEIWGPNFWPTTYDGRCLKNKAYEQYRDGVGIDKIRNGLFSAIHRQDTEPLDAQELGSLWAGTGVGLVKSMENAADIVREVQGQTRKYLDRAMLSL
ncbi:uncharacterized protein PFLUO_LOCUS8682 [Penicillium psychrofluorescens]|uniref:uncharacterized protein n=1 Tax=Penicillium psychrofluorescens TaxID=3158075 RepID=UPI003CCE5044